MIIQLNQLKERYLRVQQDLASSQSEKNEQKKNFDLYIQKNSDLLHRKELEYEKICIINNNFSTENEMIKVYPPPSIFFSILIFFRVF